MRAELTSATSATAAVPGSPSPHASSVSHTWLERASGPPLFAYTGGRRLPARRPVLVFIHGAQHDHSVWILQSRYLAHHGYGVLAVDLAGHGRSAGPAGASVEEHAAILAEGLSNRLASIKPGSIEPASIILIGHSMGSLIALELAQRLSTDRSTARSTPIAGVALLGAASPMRVSEALLAATRTDPAAAMQMINVWSHNAALRPFAAQPGTPGPGFNIVWQNLRLMERVAERNGADVLPTDFAACDAYRNGVAAIGSLRCPTLFVAGGADAMTPGKLAQPLIDAAADADVVRLPDTGHAMMAENPDGVRLALQRFAARVARLGDAPLN